MLPESRQASYNKAMDAVADFTFNSCITLKVTFERPSLKSGGCQEKWCIGIKSAVCKQ